MNKWNSCYLDFIRLAAAIVVFIGHLNYDYILGQFNSISLTNYGHDAVLVFFVLSGFIIKHTVSVHGHDLSKYISQRGSRLFSVAWPALIITIIADQTGKFINPEFYSDSWWYQENHPIIRFFFNFFLLNQIWLTEIRPFSNGPFWSLGYEAWFYIIFAANLTKGSYSFRLKLILFIFAGPRILLLYPIWLAGVQLYNKSSESKISTKTAIAYLGISFLFFIAKHTHLNTEYFTNIIFLNNIDFAKAILGRSYNFADSYITSLAIYFNLYGTINILKNLADSSINERFYLLNRALASGTFAIYATHYPVIHAVAAFNSKHQTLLLLLTPLLVASVVTIISNKIREPISRAISIIINKLYKYKPIQHFLSKL